jgi:beta-glucanase (GH16 family)
LKLRLPNCGIVFCAVLQLSLAVPAFADPTWTMTWDDEFNGAANTPPDSTRCTYDLGGGGWGNGELETYTNSTANCYQDGAGHLVIQAINSGGNYTSARIKTQGLFNQAYGRVEASLQLPQGGAGVWPAFWMLGSVISSVGWPACGEIDMMENIDWPSNQIGGHVHGPVLPGGGDYNGGSGVGGIYTLPSGSFNNSYHLFAAEWSPSSIVFYVDGTAYETITQGSLPGGGQWVFDHPFFILLNLAVGGVAGNPGATAFPQQMFVDYVRVYKRTDNGTSPFGGTAASIPGIVQAENYDSYNDTGDPSEPGEGFAYNDLEVSNKSGQYRTGDAVDIEACGDAGGGYDVDWTAPGEWLQYTLNVTQSGNYDIGARIASSGNGGTFHLDLDGTPITGEMTAPNTGGWQNWQTLDCGTTGITAGNHVLLLVEDSMGSGGQGVCNFNDFNFSLIVPPTATPAYTNTPSNTPTATPYPCGSPGSFGNSALGTGGYNLGGQLDCAQYSLSQAMTVTLLDIFMGAGTAGSGVLGIYSDAGGKPGALLVQSPAGALAPGWNLFALPPTNLPVGTYWLSASLNGNAVFDYSSAAGGSMAFESYAYTGSLPASVGSTTGYGWQMSIFASGCLLPTPTPSYTPTTTPPVCASWVTVGSAFASGGGVTLTTATNSLAGAAWNSSCIDLGQNFNMTFKAFFGAGPGADGIDFVLQQDSRATGALGEPGGDKGYLGTQPVTPSVALDLETYGGNGTLQVLENGSAANTCAYATTACPYVFPSSISNNQEHAYQVVWNASAKTLTLIVDGVVVMAYGRDLVNSVFGGNPCAYYGFTAATGGSSNLQYVYEVGCRPPTPTWTRSPTPSLTLTETQTCSPSPSRTPTPSLSATPTLTATPTCSATPSLTITPTWTDTATRTATPTFSVTPTRTSTPSFSATPTSTTTPTLTATSTLTNTLSRTGTPTLTSTLTLTDTPTRTATLTWSPTLSSSPSDSPTSPSTATPSTTPSLSQTGTATRTKTPLPSLTQSPWASASLTASSSPSATLTPTASPMHPTASPSPSLSPSALPSATAQAVPQTPGGQGPPKILKTLPLPNPNPRAIEVLLEGGQANLQLRIFSRAMVLMGSSSTLAQGGGWVALSLPQESGTQAPSGTYYYQVLLEGDKSGSVGKFTVLR